MKYVLNKIIIVSVLITLFNFNSITYGQSPPTDLTELSIEQILGLHIIKQSDESSENVETEKRSKWSAGYRYVQAKFAGMRDGENNLSNEQVLISPTNPPSDNTFPIVVLDIHQQAHIFDLKYEATDKLSFNLQLPYIIQETDHISVVAGFSDFTIRSAGPGDISLSSSLLVWHDDNKYILINGGFSLPTGSINEHGDSPAPGVSNQLPFTMQLGSGTVDFLPGITYFFSEENSKCGIQLQGTFRLGRNYRGYTLGDRLIMNVWYQRQVFKWWEPSVKLSAQAWDKITGEDIARIGTGFYPAPVADPNKFGGEKVNFVIGSKFNFNNKYLKGQSFEIDAAAPIYQSLNGPQPKEQWRFNLAWKMNF